MDLASAEAEIRHVFGDTSITEASIGAAPPDILVKLSGQLTNLDIPVSCEISESRASLSPELYIVEISICVCGFVGDDRFPGNRIFFQRIRGSMAFLRSPIRAIITVILLFS